MRACLPLLALLLLAGPAFAARRPADRPIICDAGVLRWQDTREEVALFGVNYYTPFTANFRDIGLLGADRDQAIRDDVSHFVRLGLDVVRIHVFDREISDRAGNLLDNEHLRLLDRLVDECKRNGIYVVLTPIAWWGWNVEGRGEAFSDAFTMHQMTTDPAALPPQRAYLAQFVRHRNRYTGLAYGEDPAVAAIELINEPLYPAGTTDEQVTAYIDALAGAVREAGCRKPIFYNGWAGRHAAVAKANVEGCTFGWYPTGLVAGRSLRGDFLPRVQDYPSMRDPVLAGKAIGVYEFDAADVPGSYLYPAMARAFRGGGAQFAAQFQYDPLPTAPFNAGWQTHYLNLVYAPQKALSFLIASEAFHALPRRKSTGPLPDGGRFDEFRVSFAEDLSERVSETAFLYSNDTKSRPPAPERLERVAGCGSSPVAAYEGTGAYFLDRVAPGVWRLEVYPDAVWVADPYGPDSLGHEVSRLNWRRRGLTLSLPDLGPDFAARVLTPRRSGVSAAAAPAEFPDSETARGGRVSVRPGVYLLCRRGAQPPPDRIDTTFFAPRERPGLAPVVRHEPPAECVAGRPFAIQAIVAAPDDPEVRVHYRTGAGDWQSTLLRREGPYRYAGDLPAIEPGELEYRISVGAGARALSFPGPVAEESAAMPLPRPTILFAAGPETRVPDPGLHGAPGQTARAECAALPEGGHAVRLTATGFGEGGSAAGVRLAVSPESAVRGPQPPAGSPSPVAGLPSAVVIRARAIRLDTDSVELGLVQEDGNAYGCVVPLGPEWRETRIPLEQLRPLWATRGGRPDTARVREISLVFGAWLYGPNAGRAHGLEVQSVSVVPSEPWWRVRVAAPDAPAVLLTGEERVNTQGAEGRAAATVPGKEGPAIRVSAPSFGAPPSSVSFRVDLSERLAPWQGLLAGRKALRLRVRAGEPGTSAVELVLIEADGAPWGCEVPLTREWQDVTIPWSRLRFFVHWDHPAGRGGEGDRFHPERLQAMNLCFGAWLFPERAGERHAVEVEGAWLE